MGNRHSESNNLMGFTLGALIGGAIGAVFGLLLAPRSGEETRHQLAEGAHEAKDKTSKVLEDFRGNAKTALETTKLALNEKMALLTDAIEAGRKAAGEARREWKSSQNAEEKAHHPDNEMAD